MHYGGIILPRILHIWGILPYLVGRAAHCVEQWTRQTSDKTPAAHQTLSDQLLVEPDVACWTCIDKDIIQFATPLNRTRLT